MLFTNRNAAWARWIQARLARPGTVFLAVGAGHLAGRDSVQAALARARHRARRACRTWRRLSIVLLARAGGPACVSPAPSPIGAPSPFMVIPGGVSGSFINPQFGDMQ